MDPFIDANLYVYNRLLGAVYDGVIWCLGPLVDRERAYGPTRVCLAWVTRSACRGYLQLRGRNLSAQ